MKETGSKTVPVGNRERFGTYSVRSLFKVIKGQDPEKADELERKEKILYELKKDIYLTSKENFTLERDIRNLDKKIALLIRNRISIEEVINNSEFSLVNKQGVLKNKKQRRLYGELFWLLQHDTKYLASLTGLVTLGEIDNLLQTVMFTLYGNQFDEMEEHLLLSMFKRVLETEFEKATGIGSLLRANTALTRMMTAYTRRGVGQSYLKDTLTGVLDKLCKNSDLVLEINPLKVYLDIINTYEVQTGKTSPLNKKVTAEEAAKSEEVQKIIKPRIKKLDEIATQFIDAFIKSLDDIPYGIRWICRQIRDFVKKKFPNATTEQTCSLIGGFYLLRFINPAIVTPQAFMLVESKLSSPTRRNLTLLAKILQNLANNIKFGGVKEFYMEPLNICLDRNKDRLNKFLLDLIVVEDLQDHLSLDKYLAMEKTNENTINISFNEMYFIHKLLITHKDQLVKGKRDPLLRIISDLGSAPERLPRKENANVDLVLFDVYMDRDAGNKLTPEQIYTETKFLFFIIIKSLPDTCSVAGKTVEDLLKTAAEYAEKSNDKDLKEKCKRIRANCTELLKLNYNSEDNFAQLRKDAMSELYNYDDQITKVESLTERLKNVSQNVRTHQRFLVDQSNAYKQYLDDVRGKCAANSKSGKKKQTRKQKKAAKARLIGPFKYAYNQLVKEGVIKQSMVPKERRNHITFAFSSADKGIFLVEVSWRHKKISALTLNLDDLLERQETGSNDFETDFLSLDVNKLLHLLGKHFDISRG